MSNIVQLEDASADAMMGRIVDEFLQRQDQGEQPEVEEYARRYPQLATVLRQLLPTLQLLPELSADRSDDLAPAGKVMCGEEPLGDFRIVREVGRGGMGVVYEAEQLSLGRRVALKVLPFAAALDAKRQQRFKNEAHAAAQLHHTNIVPIYAVGCERGVHYYAMQFIDGQTLATVIDELRRQKRRGRTSTKAEEEREPFSSAATGSFTPAAASSHARANGPPTMSSPAAETDSFPHLALSTEESTRTPAYFHTVANLGVQAALALEHAHSFGVIHRDIKPANLLLDGRGNLWVTDFGLAHCQNQAGLTMTGDLVGTLRYMSPESALGGAKRIIVDHRTDIYSLGVTLYELLTLAPAFNGQDRHELLRQIAVEEPKRPRRYNSSIPTELETIVLKALAKNPEERYATAQELADDLGRYLRDEPIRARRPNVVQRVRKWSRRHRAVVTTAAICLTIAVAVGAGLIGWSVRDKAMRVAKTAGEADQALLEAERLLTQARWREGRAAVRRAQALLASGGGDHEQARRAQDLLIDLQMAAKLEGIRLDRAAVSDEHFDTGRAETAFVKAWQEYGIDVDSLPAEEAANRIWARTIRAILVAALDDWAMVRRTLKVDDSRWKHLLAVAREIDPDDVRNQLRQALERSDQEGLKKLAESSPITSLPEPTVELLAEALLASGARKEALAFLRRAQQHYPGDFWINHELGLALMSVNPPQPAEALRYWTAAAALRPESPGVYVNLGVALTKQGQRDDALVAYRRAIDLKADYAAAHSNLGDGLRVMGRLPEAIDHLQRAIDLRPEEASFRYNLGLALEDGHKLEDAIAAYRRAIELQPKLQLAHRRYGRALYQLRKWGEAEAAFRKLIDLKAGDGDAYNELGNALSEQGNLQEAMNSYRKAIDLRPGHYLGHYNLGKALQERGQLTEAILELRQAITLREDYADAWDSLGLALSGQRKYAEAEDAHRKAVEFHTDKMGAYRAHVNLGGVLGWQGRQPEAVAVFRKAIEIQAEGPEAHYGLGLALGEQGKHPEAIAAFRTAIEHKADYGEAHANLGYTLQQEGEFVEAVAALTRCRALLPPTHPARAQIQQIIQNCRRLAELDNRLPATLKGDAQPTNAAERAEFAKVCAAKKLFAAAARFYGEAFREEPGLAENPKSGQRYDAARAGAQAGLALSKDSRLLNEEERARWRKQALDWLRADLVLLAQQSDTPEGRAQAAKWLRLWQRTPGFAGLREQVPLARLPAEEQQAWQMLWAKVETLLEGVNPRGKEPPPMKP